MNRSAHALTLLAVGVALALGGCGGSSSGTAGGTAAGSTAASREAPPASSELQAPQALIQVGISAGIGHVLIDSAHKTLYAFSKDKQGGLPHCYGACARVWYPKLSGETPGQGQGVDPSLLGIVKRKGEPPQATYDGRPLYTYILEKSWKSKGEGRKAFGGTWYAVRADGELVK